LHVSTQMRVDRIRHAWAQAFTIPTDAPESDGTFEWESTTLIVAQVEAGGEIGIGYSYASASAAAFFNEVLASEILGREPHAIPAIRSAMLRKVRNEGRAGIASAALSAADVALWDLKSKLLNVSLIRILGAAQEEIRIYGSGGFTSYSIERLQKQLGGWATSGFRSVKMKVGRDPGRDCARVRAAREAIGPSCELYVDANGAYSVKQALALAHRFQVNEVSWFEEPVSSDDLRGLRSLHEMVPPGMRIAAGEYGYDLFYFQRMLQAGAVDVLQVDATRCGGVSGFLEAEALCRAYNRPLSAHTAPTLHSILCCSSPVAENVEYFHDHARIENILFRGAPVPTNGMLRPDPDRPGLGIELLEGEAFRLAA